MNEETAIAVQAQATLTPAALPRLNITAIHQRVADIERVISELFTKGVHFGPPFPGSDKDSLLQAGGELLVEAFGLSPDPEVSEVDMGGGHRRFIVEGWLLAPDGHRVGRMSAECSTLEPKYRYRKAGRICPACGSDAIMASRYPDKETGEKGWYCNKKAGGCGAQFASGDESIVGQEAGRIENPDPAELWHTCRMMAQKRWLVAIARRTFALSARFVDEEGAKNALFDWQRAASLLRALPGEKAEKWDRVIAYCFREFGKPPERVTNVEGAIVLSWLGADAAAGGKMVRSDFMESPESPPRPVKTTKDAKAEQPANGHTPPPETPRVAKALAKAKISEDELRGFVSEVKGVSLDMMAEAAVLAAIEELAAVKGAA